MFLGNVDSIRAKICDYFNEAKCLPGYTGREGIHMAKGRKVSSESRQGRSEGAQTDFLSLASSITGLPEPRAPGPDLCRTGVPQNSGDLTTAAGQFRQ